MLIKWKKTTALAFVAGPFIALALWYAISFLPYLGELKSISERGSKSIRSIEHVFYPLAVAGETENGLRNYAIRQAYWSLVHEQHAGHALMWNANNILWRGASFMHFTEPEIFGLWVECALSRCDGGLNSVARNYFGKEILELSQRELAGLVAVVKSPTRYAPGTTSGERRTNEILEKAKTHHANISANE